MRVEDDTTAEAVTRADELLTQYLREHRTVLSDDQHWQAYYNEFDRADARTRKQTEPDTQPNPLPNNESPDWNARRLAAHMHARDLETKIADLNDEAPGPGDLDEAYKEMWVAGYEEELDKHLRENRHLLGDAPYWRNDYEDIDRADAAASSVPAAEVRAVAADTPLIRPDAARPAAEPFAFGAVPAAAAVAPAVVARRTR
ncbi:hypothetical protein IU459_35000 [Nocardia amamiensis]|uniref:Uncharacterized protein n=1 Tax=Nocardia amamiensis TaxID=404578 RepID=A0ABS0D3L3_9NOCA|nr:hypothetical protein [Nocardia amamiensis]MBF6302703.1 hypothetical protein [Nocardia amamiensis]